MYEFLRFYIHCTSNVLFWISARVRGCEHKCAISFIQHCIATITQCFIHPWMNQFLNESSEPVIQRSIQMVSLVSIESAVFDESFDMTDSVSHLLKQGLPATYFYCHIYLSMTGLNQPSSQPKNTFSKILFNYQYWPKCLNFRPQKEKKNHYEQ